MTYGVMIFEPSAGVTLTRSTVALGTAGPTRSKAALRMMTQKTLFVRPIEWLDLRNKKIYSLARKGLDPSDLLASNAMVMAHSPKIQKAA
jgi:hypothetical protein